MFLPISATAFPRRTRSFFRAVVFLSGALLAGGAMGKSPPNVLILVADDLGYADVGFNGGKVISTPNLDRLAETGVVLRNFHTSPVCSPTRAGLMTGRWPLRFGMMRAVVPPWSSHGLPSAEQTLPELLGGQGYDRRAIVGKWHLGHARPDYLPLNHGFTHFKGAYNGAIDYFSHEREGEVDWHEDKKTVREEGYATDLLAEAAVRFIEDSPPGKPWFLYVPFTAPHSPFQAKESDQEKYSSIKDPTRRTYAAMVDALDQAVGRILAATESRPEAENTLVLFFSDNGGDPGSGSDNRPFRGAKHSVYEGGTRVCAVVRWPVAGIMGGDECDELMGYIDVLPTVLAAAGGRAPDDVDGRNVLPAWRGEALPERPWFSYVHQGDKAHAAVIFGDWKLVAHGDVFGREPDGDVRLELYRISADVAEREDVAARNPEVVADLRRRLRDFGRLQRPGVEEYGKGRAGFRPPRDWIVE